MPLKRAEKALLASTAFSIVVGFVGFASPEWLVRTDSHAKWVPLVSLGLWSMIIDKYVGEIG